MADQGMSTLEDSTAAHKCHAQQACCLSAAQLTAAQLTAAQLTAQLKADAN
jgi:hypothetical protein